MKEYIINAKDRSLGRVASETAAVLRGKNEVSFQGHQSPNISVSVINLDKIKITGQKVNQKKYAKYSGYPGGLRFIAMKKAIGENGKASVFKKAVSGMLPSNKLYKQMIKNLIIK